jgi:hypothetical protein
VTSGILIGAVIFAAAFAIAATVLWAVNHPNRGAR